MKTIDHHLINYVDEKLKENNIDQHFNKEQLEELADNLIKGQIKRVIIEKFAPIVKQKVDEIVEDEIVKAFQHNSFQIVISNMMKTYIFSNNFRDKVTGMLELMVDRAIDCD